MREKSIKEREGGMGGAAWNGGNGKGKSRLRAVWMKYGNLRGERVGSRAVKNKKGTWSSLARYESTWSGGERKGAAGKREKVKGGGARKVGLGYLGLEFSFYTPLLDSIKPVRFGPVQSV